MDPESKNEVKDGGALSVMDHLALAESLKERTDALHEDVVKEPAIPMAVFLHEGFGLTLRARQELADLVACGLPASFPDEMERTLQALQSAQILFQLERRGVNVEDTSELLEQARMLRTDAMAAAEVALRKRPELLAKVAFHRRAGESVPELIAGLRELSTMLVEMSSAFSAVRIDVQATAADMRRAADRLQETTSLTSAARRYAGTKELRDRLYTIATDMVSELRAYAGFAFRHDRSGKRRSAFASDWNRAKVRAYRRKRGSKVPPAPSPEESAPVNADQERDAA